MPVPGEFKLPATASASGTLVLLLLAAMVSLSPAQAQELSPAPLPGLWESDWRMTGNGQDMGALMHQATQQALQQMPPGQRAQGEQGEQMMKAQGGPMAIGGKQQECLSPADAPKATYPQRMLADMQEDAPQCRFEPVSVSGSTMRFKGRCDDADGFTGDMSGNGRWLAAACGAVQPR